MPKYRYPEPKPFYHWDGREKRIQTSDEEEALGPEWFPSHYMASEELDRRLDEVSSLSDLPKYEHRPQIIDAYFKRNYNEARMEQKWAVIKQYNTHFPHVLMQNAWARSMIPNMPSDIATPTQNPPAIIWVGTARAWGDMVLNAYKEQLIKASSPLNALEQAARHYVRQKPGKSPKPFNARAVWQSLKNRDDYQNPTKSGPR